jgi:single stranded DNA-binding protein
MEKIIGYATENAEVKSFDNGKTVVNFKIAENRYYNDRNTGERKQVTRFFDCAYWSEKGTPRFAEYLLTGQCVEVEGVIGSRPYIQNEGTKEQKAVSVLTLKAREVYLHRTTAKHSPDATPEHEPATAEVPADDLPF